MECYSAFKSSEVVINVTIWMILENFMLSERNQTQKDNVSFYLYEIVRIDKFIGPKMEWKFPDAEGREMGR
jgi:hypothetical protein